MVEIEFCRAARPSAVFDHYEFGDPQPRFARWVGEDGPTELREAITVYVRCEREAGHSGPHLARGGGTWP